MQLIPKNPASEPRLMWGFVISAAFHLMLITVLVGAPSWYRPERTYFSSAYRVSLVDMPGGRPGGGKEGPGAGDAAKKVAVTEVPQTPAPPAPLKKETVEKPAVETKKAGVTMTDKADKKTVSSAAAQKAKAATAEKEYSSALSRIRDKVGEQHREEALARIRENLAGGGGSGEAAGEGGPGTGGGGGIGPGGGRIANLPLNYRLYYQAIEQKIKSNWNLALPRGILEDMRGMEVVIGITIAADGEITDVSFEGKTGNIYLDDSAYRAVKKSSPLPPFADYNIRESSFETGIVFPVGELLE